MGPGLKPPEDQPMAEAEKFITLPEVGYRSLMVGAETRASCQMLWALQKADIL